MKSEGRSQKKLTQDTVELCFVVLSELVKAHLPRGYRRQFVESVFADSKIIAEEAFEAEFQEFPAANSTGIDQ